MSSELPLLLDDMLCELSELFPAKLALSEFTELSEPLVFSMPPLEQPDISITAARIPANNPRLFFIKTSVIAKPRGHIPRGGLLFEFIVKLRTVAVVAPF